MILTKGERSPLAELATQILCHMLVFHVVYKHIQAQNPTAINPFLLILTYIYYDLSKCSELP